VQALREERHLEEPPPAEVVSPQRHARVGDGAGRARREERAHEGVVGAREEQREGRPRGDEDDRVGAHEHGDDEERAAQHECASLVEGPDPGQQHERREAVRRRVGRRREERRRMCEPEARGDGDAEGEMAARPREEEQRQRCPRGERDGVRRAHQRHAGGMDEREEPGVERARAEEPQVLVERGRILVPRLHHPRRRQPAEFGRRELGLGGGVGSPVDLDRIGLAPLERERRVHEHVPVEEGLRARDGATDDEREEREEEEVSADALPTAAHGST
jgi:hypothetical protein